MILEKINGLTPAAVALSLVLTQTEAIAAWTSLNTKYEGSSIVRVFDVTGDDLEDILVVPQGGQCVLTSISNKIATPGTFEIAYHYPFRFDSSPTWLTYEDFNSDGRIDVAIPLSQECGYEFGLLFNTGISASRFIGAQRYFSIAPAEKPTYAQARSLNADEISDPVFVCEGVPSEWEVWPGGALAVCYTQTSDPMFSTVTYSLGEGNTRPTALSSPISMAMT
jgi:hypothetical protein